MTPSVVVASGLSSADAARRLAADGPNEIAARQRHSFWSVAVDTLREPMFLLLGAICVVYVIIGDVPQAILLAFAVAVVFTIAIAQARRTDRALTALRQLASPRATVIRDGTTQRIAGRDVVRGDLLVLAEGDRVPADAVLASSVGLMTDESLLTGESVPVMKQPAEAVFGGTLVTSGHALARTTATGAFTSMGRLGLELSTMPPEPTRLQRETRRAVRVFAVLSIGACIGTAILIAVMRGSILQGVLMGLTLAIAMVPEELPMVLAVFLGLGAWRMARRQVLTRRTAAIDTLGAATVLCVDKTGTLTENRLRVACLDIDGATVDVTDPAAALPSAFRALLVAAARASLEHTADPVDRAIHAAAVAQPAAGEAPVHIRDYPFASGAMRMGRAWRCAGDAGLLIAVKGAPEAIAAMCGLDDAARAGIEARARHLAAQGFKVLAIASATRPSAAVPDSLDDDRYVFLGLAGLTDPVRPDVRDAMSACVRAGIRVIMVTGDYPETARQVARRIGLPDPDRVITGADLAGMDDGALARHIMAAHVFARILPDQKLRIVRALRARGDVVAMTGDGVNDAPALAAAHIGVAMGRRGSDVAREAADLVLLDDRFASLVDAVALGRRIYDNLRRAMSYIVAAHIPIAGLALLPVLFGWPPILLPVHIIFFELIVDPACSVAFEAEPAEARAMSRPPRDPRTHLFDRGVVAAGWIQGLVLLAVVMAVFGFALAGGRDALEARALAFVTLVLLNLSLIWISRSGEAFNWRIARTANRPLWGITAATLIMLAAVLYVPAVRQTFQFTVLHVDDVLIAVGAAVAAGGLLELAKIARGADRPRPTPRAADLT